MNSTSDAQGERLRRMSFASVYPLYLRKAERKGRRAEEVDEIISWLTGYDKEALRKELEAGSDFESFFDRAPALNPKAALVTGMICGYRVEEIHDPLVRKIRCLDKLIDELAKGRPMAKILRA